VKVEFVSILRSDIEARGARAATALSLLEAGGGRGCPTDLRAADLMGPDTPGMGRTATNGR